MKGSRHTPEQVVRKLHEADKLIGQHKDLAAVFKHLQVSEQTYYRWRKRYGELSPDDARRLRELEGENARLKKLVAEQALDIRHAESRSMLPCPLVPGRSCSEL